MCSSPNPTLRYLAFEPRYLTRPKPFWKYGYSTTLRCSQVIQATCRERLFFVKMGPLDSALGNLSPDQRSELNDSVQCYLAPNEQVRAAFLLKGIGCQPFVFLTDYRVICLGAKRVRSPSSASLSRTVTWRSVLACDIVPVHSTVVLHFPASHDSGWPTYGVASQSYVLSPHDAQEWGPIFCQEFSQRHGSAEMKMALSYSP
jgi:hypothetical protein